MACMSCAFAYSGVDMSKIISTEPLSYAKAQVTNYTLAVPAGLGPNT